MGFQSKTYSLSDDVVAAIDEARQRGLSPNRFLRLVMGIEGPSADYLLNAPDDDPLKRRWEEHVQAWWARPTPNINVKPREKGDKKR